MVALIEIKHSREHKALQSAISQLLQYRRQLGKPHVPLYLFYLPPPNATRQFDIAQILESGDTKEISPTEFPGYDALVSADRLGVKATRKKAAKAAIDTFQVTCTALAIIVVITLVLDVMGILMLTTKQMILGAVAGALLILPFAARVKMLGVEFERHYPESSTGKSA